MTLIQKAKIFFYIIFITIEIGRASNKISNEVVYKGKPIINGSASINLKSGGTMFLPKKEELSISNILKSKKNKSDELTTESAIEEVTLIDLSNDLSSPGYENVTDDYLESANSTDLIGTTQVPTEASTTPETTKKHKKEKKFDIPRMLPSSICSCDLTKSICDVNCCCDKECSESHRNVFTECQEEAVQHPVHLNALQQCYSKDTFFFMNNTHMLMYEEHTPTSHLFCVIKDNLPPRLMNKEPKVIESLTDLNKLGENYYQWIKEEHTDETAFDASKPYMYGDNIWMIYNSTLKILDLATATLNAHCNKMVKMKYMKDFKSKCSVSTGRWESNVLYRLYSGIDDTYIIAAPNQFNVTWISNIQDCPQNVCIPFQSFICDDTFCLMTNETEDIATSKQWIRSIKINLYSNGTTGYVNASVYFGLMDSNNMAKYVDQEIEVHQSFIGKNKLEIGQALSGNPGYQNGKPIILSTITKNDSILDFFTPPNLHLLRNILYLPKNVRGKCVLSNLTYNTIKFRENIHFSCKIIHNLFDAINEDNATKLCINLQDYTYNFLPPNVMKLSKIYAARIGNPSQNMYDWIQILIDQKSDIVKGTFNEEKTTVSCTNIVQEFVYLFAYAIVEQPNIPKQNHLIGVALKFISRDVTLKISNKSVVASNFIAMSRFVDVTKPQPLKFARGPYFHIHLPQDFFYPFAFSTGSLNYNYLNIFVYAFVLCLILQIIS